MSDTFSPTDQHSLAPFFTNLTDDIFGLKLPQEVAGALFSRYSRSNKSLRRIFRDEFLGEFFDNTDLQTADLPGTQDPGTGQTENLANTDNADALQKARAFYDRVLVGYGDDSVAQLGGAHIACENISNVAAKLIEDARIGIAPLEKSTRYVRFDTTDDTGEFLFAKEPAIMASPHRDAYLSGMRQLFETYAAQMEPMIAFMRRSLPIETVEWKHPQTGEPLTYKDTESDAKLQRWAEGAYRSTVRAQACDVLRQYLPAATLTNVGIFGVGQAFEHLLNKLYSQPLEEGQTIAHGMHTSLNALIPSFMKRAKASSYLSDTYASVRTIAAELLQSSSVEPSQPVHLIDYDDDAEDKILAAILYPHVRQPLQQLRTFVKNLSAAPRAQIFNEYIARRTHRREKPGRALEQAYYTFDIVGNLGLYRDLQRHRLLTQERQDFTTSHGYDIPQEIEEAGFKDAFARSMDQTAELYKQIYRDLPFQAQYVVPFAYRIRWTMKMNLREAVHIGELRTMPQGHPDYRLIVQDMWRQIQAVHPLLAQSAKFLDWNTYRLGRLQSEIRTEYKRDRTER